jgi:hypothetical protein
MHGGDASGNRTASGFPSTQFDTALLNIKLFFILYITIFVVVGRATGRFRRSNGLVHVQCAKHRLPPAP